MEKITVTPTNTKPFIQADGTQIETANVNVKIIKEAIQFCIS